MTEGRQVLVTFHPEPGWKEAVAEGLDGAAEIVYLEELPQERRAEAITGADALLSFMVHNELSSEEFALLREGTLIQTLLAGVDAVPFLLIPKSVTICANTGAWAEPMAEHILGMMLALGKRLLPCHQRLARGEFWKERYNTWFQGKQAGFIGFGGIGKATSRLLRPLGMEVSAVSRSGATDEPGVRIETMEGLDDLLAASDVVVIAVPLTIHTKGLIGTRELKLMKPDAILINPARGPVIDEQALYEHMTAFPDFKAGIDAWWTEPATHGEFRTGYPFFELENCLGSPHNSNLVEAIYPLAVRRAAENVRTALEGGTPGGIVDPAEYAH